MMINMPALVLVSVLAVTDQASIERLPDPTKPFQHAVDINIEQSFLPDEKVIWHLNGIRINKNKKSAILNGKLVKEGDRLKSVTVIEINQSEVVLLEDNKRITVKLLLSDIKKPAKNAMVQQ